MATAAEHMERIAARSNARREYEPFAERMVLILMNELSQSLAAQDELKERVGALEKRLGEPKPKVRIGQIWGITMDEGEFVQGPVKSIRGDEANLITSGDADGPSHHVMRLDSDGCMMGGWVLVSDVKGDP